MSSCSFGTLANLARLPMREDVDNFRVKSGDILRVRVGGGYKDEGGVMEIWGYGKRSL